MLLRAWVDGREHKNPREDRRIQMDIEKNGQQTERVECKGATGGEWL